MRFIGTILLSLALVGGANAQSGPGLLPAFNVVGNPTASTAPPTAYPIFSTANTWSAVQNFNSSFACTTTTALAPCFNTSQISTGGTTVIPLNLNQIVVQEGITSGANFVNGIGLIHNIVGGTGGRQSFQIATSMFNTSTYLAGANNFIAAFEATVMIDKNIGGTAPTPAGQVFGFNPEVTLHSNATFIAQATAQETNVDVQVGASVGYLAGITIVQQATHKVQGYLQDVALAFSNFSGAAGWQCLVCAGSFATAESPFGQAGANGATYLGVLAPGGGHAAPSFKFGIDFINAAPVGTDASTGFPFRSGQAGVANYTVDWNGNIVGVSITAGVLITGTATLTGTSGTVTATTTIVNPSGGFTITLPSAVSGNGRILLLKLIANQTVTSASANVVPLAGGAATTTVFSAATAGKYVQLYSDGTAWQIMAAN